MSWKRRPGGETWLGCEVEVYWESTKRWERGRIVNYRPLRDEYQIEYENAGELETQWEVVDDMFRFVDEEIEEQKRQMLKRTANEEQTIVDELFAMEHSLDVWLPKFIHKLYVFLGKDKQRVLRLLNTDSSIEEEVDEFVREKPFPILQKLDRIKRLLNDEAASHKVSEVLLDDERYPIAKRRSTLRQAEELERRKVGRSEGRAKVPEKDAESSEDKARKGRLRKREFEIKDKADKDAKPAPVTTLEPLKDNKTPQNGAKRGPGRPRKYPVVEEAPVKSEPPRSEPVDFSFVPPSRRASRSAQALIEQQQKILREYEEKKSRRESKKQHEGQARSSASEDKTGEKKRRTSKGEHISESESESSESDESSEFESRESESSEDLSGEVSESSESSVSFDSLGGPLSLRRRSPPYKVVRRKATSLVAQPEDLTTISVVSLTIPTVSDEDARDVVVTPRSNKVEAKADKARISPGDDVSTRKSGRTRIAKKFDGEESPPKLPKRGRDKDKDKEPEAKRARVEGSTRKSSIVPIKPIVAQSPQHLPVGTVLADNAAFVATFASDLRALPSSSTTVAQRLTEAKSLIPAKKLWVLHQARRGDEWDIYLCQGPRLSKQNVALVTISEEPYCTCDEFARLHIPCTHLLFTYVCLFSVAEDSPLLSQATLTPDELQSLLSLVPPGPFPRLAPVHLTRTFNTWFELNVSDAARRETFKQLVATAESKPSPSQLSRQSPSLIDSWPHAATKPTLMSGPATPLETSSKGGEAEDETRGRDVEMKDAEEEKHEENHGATAMEL